MSLINDALKQAQREAHGDNAPAVRDVHVSGAASSVGRSRFPLFFGALIAASVAGAGYWFYVKPEAPAPVPPKVADTAPKITAPAPEPTVPAPKSAIAPPVAHAPAIAATVAAAPAKATSSGSSEPAVVIPGAEPVSEAVAPPVPVKNPALIEMVASMRLSLVRKATSRAVIDGVVVKVGDQLCEQPRLVLAEVTDSGVVFKDAAGLMYEKRLK